MSDIEKTVENAVEEVKETAAKATKKVAKKAKAVKKTAKKATNKVAKKASKKAATAKKTASKAAKSAKKAVESNSVEDRIEQLQNSFRENLSGLNTEKAEQLAKNIWLAGLGAYSRTLEELNERGEEIQERYSEMNQETQKFFEELVERGESMQGEAENAFKQGRSKLESRVEEFRQRFGGGLSSFVDIPGRLREAAEKIEEISSKLEKKGK